MLTVYLDQNKWVDLSRAHHGVAAGKPFERVFADIQEAVDAGRAQFPLSTAHYFETHKTSNPDRRHRLAQTMQLISRGLRIAPPHVIVPWEIERALSHVFDVGSPVAEIAMFGHGAAHAFASPSLRYEAPATFNGTDISQHERLIRAVVTPAFELALLSGVSPPEMPRGLFDQIRAVIRQHQVETDNKFVTGQELVRDKIKELGRHRTPEVMLASTIADIRVPLARAAYRLGIPIEEFADLGRLAEVVHHAPSRWVEMELRRVRQANPEKSWEGNDLNDVIALAVAIPYCDVVVTERSWTSLINAARIADRFGTKVTRDVRLLSEVLRDV